MQDKDMEVRRLQAARVALERRLSQLSGSKDRRVGIPTPYVPQSERPWREKGYREAMAKALKAGVAIDPTADMSMQWEDEQSQQTALDMQQELVSTTLWTFPLGGAVTHSCLTNVILSRACA